MTGTIRPTTILVAALGGEGGGVLADWIVGAATHQGLPAQAAAGEAPGEVAQSLGAHGLGPVEGHFPATNIELLFLFGGDLLGAQLVGEVGPPARCGTILRDGRQPTERLL